MKHSKKSQFYKNLLKLKRIFKTKRITNNRVVRVFFRYEVGPKMLIYKPGLWFWNFSKYRVLNQTAITNGIEVPCLLNRPLLEMKERDVLSIGNCIGTSQCEVYTYNLDESKRTPVILDNGSCLIETFDGFCCDMLVYETFCGSGNTLVDVSIGNRVNQSDGLGEVNEFNMWNMRRTILREKSNAVNYTRYAETICNTETKLREVSDYTTIKDLKLATTPKGVMNYTETERLSEYETTNDTVLRSRELKRYTNETPELIGYTMKIESLINSILTNHTLKKKKEMEKSLTIKTFNLKIRNQNKLINEIKSEIENKQNTNEFHSKILHNTNELKDKIFQVLESIEKLFQAVENLKKTKQQNFTKFIYEKESKKDAEKTLKIKEQQLEILIDDILRLKNDNKSIGEIKKLKDQYKTDNMELKKQIEIIKEEFKNMENEKNVEIFSVKRDQKYLLQKIESKEALIKRAIKNIQHFEIELDKFSLDFQKLAIFNELFKNEYLKKTRKLKRVFKMESELKDIYKQMETLDLTFLVKRLALKNNSLKMKLKEEKENILKYENQLIESHEIIQLQKKLIQNLNEELKRYTNNNKE